MRVAVFCMAALACSVRLSAQGSAPISYVDKAAVAAFAEEFFPAAMSRRHIPGLVFVFVSGGEIAIARGFGAADLERNRPVDPDRTTFGLASVSKTITATAALQLVERKKLDLHTDVNTYLRAFKLPARHGPITLHHLLTHTAGFDERLTGVATRSPRELLPSALYLASSMPTTFIEPGRVISYSNHGYALVGHLVEEISGRPFADYVRAEIFDPLEMSRSGSLSGPTPEAHSIAYEYGNGQHRPLAPDYLQISSAGSFYTAGTDMGRFLIAHLRAGAYRDRRILQPETLAMMHAQQFAQTPGTTGWAYGLWEDARDGQRALLHNGGGKGFRALIYLVPQHDAGFFIGYNLADRHEEGELQEVFITQFRNRFVARSDTSGAMRSEPASTASFAGDYLYVRRARATVEKLMAIVNRVRIRTDEEGNLLMTSSSGDPVRLVPIGGRLFRREDGRGIVEFDADAAGRPERLLQLMDSGFPALYERIPLFATLRAQVAILGALLLAFVYAGLWRPASRFVRRSRGVSKPINWSTRVASVASALNVVFLIGFPPAFVGRSEGGVPEFLYGVPPLAAALLFIPPLTAIAAVAVTLGWVLGWNGHRRFSLAPVDDFVVVIALNAFTLLAFYWRLMPGLGT